MYIHLFVFELIYCTSVLIYVITKRVIIDKFFYPQTQFVEDGARATPNTSLTDEEKLKICMEQLKEKEEEIIDLNGQITELNEQLKVNILMYIL